MKSSNKLAVRFYAKVPSSYLHIYRLIIERIQFFFIYYKIYCYKQELFQKLNFYVFIYMKTCSRILRKIKLLIQLFSINIKNYLHFFHQ